MSTLLPGTKVRARGLPWEVVFVQTAGEQQLCRLRCLEGALRGAELDLLSPFEKIEPITLEIDPTRASRLAQWRVYHQAFLLEQALGPSALLAAQPGRLRIEPYQLVPLMRVLQMSRPRLMLADGVGLGKTIQAGLIVAELIARRRAHRVLIVSPAGPLLRQWQTEMRERFGLRFQVLDREAIQKIRYANELGANPFDHVALGLISIDFAKQEKVLQELERAQYDVVIIDEAHHCTRLGNAGDREDSLRRRLAEVLAKQSDGLLLLTATPHDGYDPHFSSLVDLLDPSLLDGRGNLRGDSYRRHVVRRLKRHIKTPEGQPMFQERQVHPCPVLFSREQQPDFFTFQEDLLLLIGPRLKRAFRQKRYEEVLAFLSLLKRSVSTVVACQKTLENIAGRLGELAEKGPEAQEARKQRLKTLRDYQSRLERFGTLSFEEEEDQASLEAEDMAAELAENGADELIERLKDQKGELTREIRREQERIKKLNATREGLLTLAKLAQKAAPQDPKLVVLLEELKAIRAAAPHANVLVYTEYSDSQDEIVAFLERARERQELTGTVIAISGRDNENARSEAAERFGQEDDIILVSTDATAEGLNLHNRCYHLLHLELPYNPNRLEQRNGRIDRFGQKYEPQVRYLYLSKTFEERILMRLVAKYENQRKRLSFVPNTLGFGGRGAGREDAPPLLQEKLLAGLAQEDSLLSSPQHAFSFAQASAQEPEEDTTSRAYQELLEEVESAFVSFEKTSKTNAWLGEEGIGAEERLLEEADRARREGCQLGAVDLLGFVVEAVRANADSSAAQQTGDLWELRLPNNWTHGLEDIPGYDGDRKLLRLTTDIHRERDPEGRPVGYLGRAHPIVRRALDWARTLQFGAQDDHLDRRVSAARAKDPSPSLLITCLGLVQSGAGRAFERVLAVRIGQSGAPAVMTHHDEWADLAAPERAVPTRGVWEKYFQSWGQVRQKDALSAARDIFAGMAQTFASEHAGHIDKEERELDSWLRKRTEELCGPVQRALGDLLSGPAQSLPRWQTLTVEPERLAALAADDKQTSGQRREAQGVLALYQRRKDDLKQRGALKAPEVSLLGVLMFVPSP